MASSQLVGDAITRMLVGAQVGGHVNVACYLDLHHRESNCLLFDHVMYELGFSSQPPARQIRRYFIFEQDTKHSRVSNIQISLFVTGRGQPKWIIAIKTI